jgi:phospholipase/lecithinase/hemolysin
MQNKGYNPELTIKWDETAFAETPKDHHPSLTCHQVMAENIIKRIERDTQ